MADILVIGASALAREALNVIRSGSEHRACGVLDDSPPRWGTSIGGVPVLGGVDTVAQYPGASLVICVSLGSTRARLVNRLQDLGVRDDRYAQLIHPSVEVPRNCRVGVGSIILAGVVMTADVMIGRHVVIMPNVTLTHGNRIQSFATLGAGSALGPGVRVGEEATLGMNSTVRDRVRVGDRSVLGLGSALLRDQPPGETWMGVPAAPNRTTETTASNTPPLRSIGNF
ncbi:NeuD/PglB/VioB family sugar acetyltransferase [Subtercola boreus]|uniref:NeuD/PglB/VioB family sugar acetyltransferase n=1 Tax=Subtercola boreus TaxID=120213 RepID=UPI001FE7403D|nr:NeuD/PglB/VioB family sugar acetyltransferase [Subtercola boreus]